MPRTGHTMGLVLLGWAAMAASPACAQLLATGDPRCRRDPQGRLYRDSWPALELDDLYVYLRKLKELVQHVRDHKIGNVVSLTDDQHFNGLFAAGRVLSRAPSRDLLLKTPMGKVLMLTPLPKLTWAQMEAALDILDEALADEARA